MAPDPGRAPVGLPLHALLAQLVAAHAAITQMLTLILSPSVDQPHRLFNRPDAKHPTTAAPPAAQKVELVLFDRLFPDVHARTHPAGLHPLDAPLHVPRDLDEPVHDPRDSDCKFRAPRSRLSAKPGLSVQEFGQFGQTLHGERSVKDSIKNSNSTVSAAWLCDKHCFDDYRDHSCKKSPCKDHVRVLSGAMSSDGRWPADCPEPPAVAGLGGPCDLVKRPVSVEVEKGSVEQEVINATWQELHSKVPMVPVGDDPLPLPMDPGL
mmetsp:Transcript_135928/g.422280  ORF Transcript_135928/g.422280 Transcript_135928/m.422280 type:complete len:265 (-) Transcript_135928:436-1230(-)